MVGRETFDEALEFGVEVERVRATFINTHGEVGKV
jgi:hypothetical protein